MSEYRIVHDKQNGNLNWKLIEKNNKFGIQTDKGVIICPTKYSLIMPFFHGIALVRVKKVFAKKEQWGYVNEKGQEILFPKEYEDVQMLNHNLIAIKVFVSKGVYKWALIDRANKMITAPKYDSCPGIFINGLAEVCSDGYYAFIDETGKQICYACYEPDIKYNKDGTITVYRAGKQYKLNNKGKEIL